MVQIKAIKKMTLTEQIMEQIANLITSGAVQAGDQLPNERDLASQFQVTRGRVREALRALSLIGLVTIKAGEGSFVNKQETTISPETITWMFYREIHNLDEIYAARKLIESEIFCEAAKKATAPDIAHLQNLLRPFSSVKNQTNPRDFLAVLDQFDLYMGDICGNRVYHKLMQTIIHLRRETSMKLLAVPGAIESSVKTRRALITAIESRDAQQVHLAIQQFFANSKKFYDSIIRKQP